MSTARKRTHLSSEKLAVLEESFNENVLPDSALRKELAHQLAVPERTVQIWFQNRRAKEKKNKAAYESDGQYEPAFHSMITPEVYEQPISFKRLSSVSKPETKMISAPEGQRLSLHQRALSERLGITQALSKNPHSVQIIPLNPNMLRVGTWTRFSSEQQAIEWDLFCHVNMSERIFVWKIRAGKHQFKIEFSFDHIRYIQLQHTGQLDICLYLPISFAMLRFGQDTDWVTCGDFTENQQATINPIHTLQGNFETTKRAILDILSLAPELSTRIIGNVFELPGLDINREYTISPSLTPEPFMLQYNESIKTRANTAPLHLQIPNYSLEQHNPLMYTQPTTSHPFSFL